VPSRFADPIFELSNRCSRGLRAVRRGLGPSGVNEGLSPCETRDGGRADQAGTIAAGESGARILGGSLDTKSRNWRAISMVLIG
jgi:hypothetical protein